MVSVVMRCRNEDRWIGHSIQSVIDIFDNPEIIIVDNNSTDESMSIVNMFKKDKSLKDNTGSYADIKIYNICLRVYMHMSMRVPSDKYT